MRARGNYYSGHCCTLHVGGSKSGAVSDFLTMGGGGGGVGGSEGGSWLTVMHSCKATQGGGCKRGVCLLISCESHGSFSV